MSANKTVISWLKSWMSLFMVPEYEIYTCLQPAEPYCPYGMTSQYCATLYGRTKWLIKVRWGVIAVALAGILSGSIIFPDAANWFLLGSIIFALGIFNIFWQRLTSLKLQTICYGELYLSLYQILVDFILLSFAVYLTGGITGQLTPLFVLHVVFATVLLPRKFAYRVMLIAFVLITMTAFVYNLLDFKPVWLFLPSNDHYIVMSKILRFGFLMLATFGAAVIGLNISKEIRAGNHRIEMLVRELEARNTDLTNINQQRIKLLGVASHDLKSPLSAVEMKMDMLKEGYMGDLTDLQKEEIGKMQKRLESLRYFINDVLDMTAVDLYGRSTEQNKPVDISTQLKNTISELGVLASKNGLRIEHSLPEQPVFVSAPEKRMARVWQNLISNALKYGVNGEKVDVVFKQDGKDIHVSITDHGIGISQEDVKHLFEDFFRAKNAVDKKIPGTGLGLSIVKRIVQSAGGTISVSSELGHGTTFTVNLQSTDQRQEAMETPK